MEQLITAFGIDTRLIIIQMINFFVLVAALSYFLYKPVLKLLKEREETIAQGIKDAENAANAKDAADKEKQAVLSKAHQEASDIAQQAKVFAQTKADEIVVQAQEKAAGTISAAQARGEEIKVQAKKESEAEIAKVAILAAEKVLQAK